MGVVGRKTKEEITSKVTSNDSPGIPNKVEISDIPGLPWGGGGGGKEIKVRKSKQNGAHAHECMYYIKRGNTSKTGYTRMYACTLFNADENWTHWKRVTRRQT